MDNECNNCGGTDFTADAGFYYCDECGLMTEAMREIDCEAFTTTQNISKVKKTKIKKEKAVELTSIEERNFILLAWTEKLIDFGVDPSFKLIVFQLWSHYLKYREGAFFDLKKTSLPKLVIRQPVKDAAILYKHRKKRRLSKTSRSEKSVPSNKSSAQNSNDNPRTKLAQIYDKTRLQRAEYDSFMADNQSSIFNQTLEMMTLKNLSEEENSSANSEISKKLEYSRLTRKTMKRKHKMRKGHIEKHAKDNEKLLTCHDSKQIDTLRKIEDSAYVILLQVIETALRVLKSDIGISDIIRFYREGFFMDLERYLADYLPIKKIAHLTQSLKYISTPSYDQHKSRSDHFVNKLHVQLDLPDFYKLCQKFLIELCLPKELLVFIERLLSLSYPKMRLGGYPEARAMGYIIFLLKLLFGLNDVTEDEISESATVINRKIEDLQIECDKLFVWDDWVNYIAMRKVILSQCHYKTAQDTDPYNTKNTELYVNELFDMKVPKTDKIIGPEKPFKSVFAELQEEHFKSVHSLHHRPFAPSLTPNTSYLKRIIEEKEERKIFIPDFMNIDHSARSIKLFLKPNILVSEFAKHEFSLTPSAAKSSVDNLRFIPLSNNYIFEARLEQLFVKVVKPNRNTKKKEAVFQQEKLAKAQEFHDKKMKQALAMIEAEAVEIDKPIQIDFEQEQEQARKVSYSFSIQSEDIVENLNEIDDILMSPREMQEEYLFTNLSDVEGETMNVLSGKFDQTITFITPNYLYWLNVLGLSVGKKEARVRKLDFPKNFEFLLNECARLLEMRPVSLYSELLNVEEYFCNVLKPVDCLKNMLEFQASSVRRNRTVQRRY